MRNNKYRAPGIGRGDTSRGKQHSFRLQVLGAFRLERDGRVLDLTTRKNEALFAYLALHPQEHAREKLAALFWGDSSDAQARHSLNVALNTLRKTVGADWVVTDRATVQVHPAFPLSVDAREIYDLGLLISDLSQYEAQQIINLKLKIINYQDLLADFYDDWILAEREEYRTRYLEMLLASGQRAGAEGDYVHAIEYAQRVLETDPASERAHQQLMFCFVATGERLKALEQYERCVNALRLELNVNEPSPETTALYEWIRQTSTALARGGRLTNLPLPITSFIGRGKELQELKERLKHARLVTLTGAGGSGKTRLAVQTGIQLLETFRNGVWWIDLAPLTDPARVAETALREMGLQAAMHQEPVEALLHALGAEQRLLIFDNCEHLLDASARLIEQLLRTCPDLKILTTSREPLNLTGETVYFVQTLRFPDSKQTLTPDAAGEFEAIRLFVQRAQAVDAQFSLNPENAEAVTQICARLDGIPLAIELAAARMNTLSASEIAGRLDDRFALLTRGSRTALPRQQTLHAMIEWSYNLLNEDERRFFKQLAIFAGGFTLEAAENVAGDKGRVTGQGSPAHFEVLSLDTLTLLSRLVEKSLVGRNTYGETTRYTMLETIREFAEAALNRDPANYAQAAKRHLDYFHEQGKQFHREMRDSFPWHRFDFFLQEVENMQVGVTRAFGTRTLPGYTRTQQLSRGMMMINMLWLMWFHRGANVGTTQALARILELPDVPVALRLRALMLSVLIARTRAEWGTARELGYELRDRAGKAENRAMYARALDQLGLAERDHLNLNAALEHWSAARRVFEKIGANLDAYRCDMFLGETQVLLGNTERGQRLIESALGWFEKVNDAGHIAWAHEWLANIARLEGRLAEAGAAYRSTLGFKCEIKDKHAITFSLDALAQLAVQENEPGRAVRLWAASNKLRKEVSARSPALAPLYESLLPVAREQLGEELFGREWARGQELTLDQAVELALRDDRRDTAVVSPGI